LVVDVTTVDWEGADQVVAADAIPFDYRTSGLTDCVIVEATLAFAEQDPAVLKREMRALFRWRKAGTPFDQACCGSVFRNPGGERTAGQFIEHAGLKGFTIGQVQVSPKHANYFVNLGDGTADDVRRLIEHTRATVQREFGVELRTEIEIISAG
jgi:UDP-N-acetylmuramate dehydrogenase